MQCKNPMACKAKHSRWKKYQEKYIPTGEKLLEHFRNNWKQGKAIAKRTDHFALRCFQRSISNATIHDVLENGWIVEYGFEKSTQLVRLVLLWYTKGNYGGYRPIHLVIEYKSEQLLTLITVYSPESMAYKWDKNYSERICFCDDDEKGYN